MLEAPWKHREWAQTESGERVGARPGPQRTFWRPINRKELAHVNSTRKRGSCGLKRAAVTFSQRVRLLALQIAQSSSVFYDNQGNTGQTT